MEQFLRKLILFIVLPTVYFAFNASVNYLIYSSQIVDVGKPNIIVIGDSHPMAAVNTNMLDNAINISRSAEPYVLTYWKLKAILKNHIPEILIIGFSPHNISAFNDKKFSDPDWSSEMFKRSYPIQQFDDIRNDIPIDEMEYYKTLWKRTAFFPTTNHIYYLGTFNENRTTSNISNWQDRVQRHFYVDSTLETPYEVSKIAVVYLDSIINLSQQYNIQTVLLGPPVHKYYYNEIPAHFLEAYEQIKNKYSQDVLIFDMLTDSTYVDEDFLDANHLNIYGANKLTTYLIHEIERHNFQFTYPDIHFDPN